jgi:hypothetical protein
MEPDLGPWTRSMTRSIHKLSARAVATLAKPGRHSDGGGLYLSISRDGATNRSEKDFLFGVTQATQHFAEALVACDLLGDAAEATHKREGRRG